MRTLACGKWGHRREKLGRRLETVDLDGVRSNALFGEECLDLLTLITLKLDYLSSLLIINESAVASEFLRGRFIQ